MTLSTYGLGGAIRSESGDAGEQATRRRRLAEARKLWDEVMRELRAYDAGKPVPSIGHFLKGRDAGYNARARKWPSRTRCSKCRGRHSPARECRRAG